MARRSVVRNTNETLGKLESLGVDMKAALGEMALAGAFVLEGSVKREMASKKSGREYSRGNKTHVASAPGESPAPDTGALLNSIQSELGDVSNTSATALCGTNMEYAQALEEGTSRMEARPFMRPGAERENPNIENAMRSVARQVLENARQ